MIGSSDAHTGLAAMEEDNFFGKTAPQEPSPERMTKAFFDNPKTGVKIMDWEVERLRLRRRVGDREHARGDLRRDEAPRDLRHHGPADGRALLRRLRLRRQADAHNRMPAAVGYAKGVPMGGDLSSAPQGKSPTFLVAALKDPIGANLDRIQVIKGWLDKDGKTQEQVYDVAGSGGRKPDADGKLPPVGNTVDVDERHLDQHHRRARTDRRLEGPAVRRRSSAPSTTPA